MSTGNSNSKTIQYTIPTDMGFRRQKWVDNLKTIVREVVANAVRHGATQINGFMAHYKGEMYVIIGSDADSFESEAEIIRPGLTPHQSYLEGNANQGAGLPTVTMAACERHRNPLLVIASFCGQYPKDNLTACKAYPDVNVWVPTPAPDWKGILRQMIGRKLIEAVNNRKRRVWSVTVGVKITAPVDSSCRAEDITGMSFAAGDMIDKNVELYFCDRPIDCDKGQSVETVLETEKDHKQRSLSNVFRRIVTHAEFKDRYCHKTFKIPCEEFRMKVGDKFEAVFRGANIIVEAYPGPLNNAYLANIRECEAFKENSKTGEGKIGAGSGMGKYPIDKIYLTAPFVHSDIKMTNPQKAQSFSRYQTNSLGTYSQPETFFSDLLGLTYINYSTQTRSIEGLVGEWANNPAFEGRRKPVLIAYVALEGSPTLYDIEVEKEKPYHAHAFLEDIRRRPDFYAEAESVVNDLTRAAAKAARRNVPAELKTLCDLWFYREEHPYCPISWDEDVIRGKRTEETRRSEFMIFDLDAPTLEFGKVDFQAGQNRRFSIIYIPGEKWLAPDNTIIETDITRGVILSPPRDVSDIVDQIGGNVAKNYAELLATFPDKHIPVFAAKVDELHRLIDNVDEPITAEEYTWTSDCFPSRAVVQSFDGKRINTGYVQEVPIRPRGPVNVPARTTTVNDPHGKKGKGKESHNFDYRWNGDDSTIPFNFHTRKRRLKINMSHPFGKRYYDRPVVEGSEYHKLAVELYRMLSRQANLLFDVADKSQPEIKADLESYLLDGKKPEAWFFFINYVLDNSLTESWVIQYTKKMDKLIAQDEERAEAQPAA